MVAKRVLAVAQRATSAARSTARRVSGASAAPPGTGTTAATTKKTTTKKATTTAKKTAKKTAAKKTAAKKATTTKATAPSATKKTTTKKKAPAPTAAATKAATQKAPAKPSAAAKKTTTPTTKAAPATTMTASKKTTSAQKVAPAKEASGTVRGAVSPRSLAVLDHEDPWTAAELRAVRAEVEADIERLVQELHTAESELVDLMRDSGDGTGDDQADAGAKTYEREQEISLANNAREMLNQNEHALGRLDNGTYGTCESCGNPIGKLRLQAAPRATLCMPCKTKEERR